jgi:8-oxo-dGTP pyrophosphatase MutT (NUDIX family)
VSGPLATVPIDGVPWQVIGAQVAVLDDSRRVLLQFRPWPPGWELPGGHCESDEDPAEAARREAEEETGYHITIDRLVGVYTWAGLRSAGDALYLASVSGGAPRRSLEAWTSKFFSADALPHTAFPWLQQRIGDALAVADGGDAVHRVQPVTVHHVLLFGTAWMRAPLDRLRRLRRRIG